MATLEEGRTIEVTGAIDLFVDVVALIREVNFLCFGVIGDCLIDSIIVSVIVRT